MQTHHEFYSNITPSIARLKFIKIALEKADIFFNSFRTIKARVHLVHRVKVERLSMQRLTDAELKDMGIHRAEAERESARGFFDVPENRE